MGFVYIYLNNPPVNALSSSTRQTLLSQVKAAENDDEVFDFRLLNILAKHCLNAFSKIQLDIISFFNSIRFHYV